MSTKKYNLHTDFSYKHSFPFPFFLLIKQIMEELRSNGINIYQFPTDDEAVLELNSKMNDVLPFAVVGSREEVVLNGVKVRARKYPWGTVEGEWYVGGASCD